jgi:crotonobetaine/carnitine-CoA ligase
MPSGTTKLRAEGGVSEMHPVQDTVLDILQALPGDPHETVFVFEGRDVELSRRELVDRIARMARGLADLGVRNGDRVAALLDNGPAIVEAWFAAEAIGAVWVPVNTGLRGAFLAHVLNDSGAAVLLSETDLLAQVEAVAGDLSELRHVVEAVEGADATLTRIGSSPVIPLTQLRSSSPVDRFVAASAADLACLIYTSGTTGPSKGCMLPHGYITNLSRNGIFGRHPDEPKYTSLPLFHLNAMTSVVSTLILGGRLTIGQRFSVSGFWPSIEASGARFVSILGPMATLLANAPDNDAMMRCKGQLRKVLSAPFTAADRKVFRERFGVTEVDEIGGYGLTEAAPITWTLPGQPPQPPGASGRRIPLMDVQVVDDDDNVLPPGAVGEVVCRPNYPNVMFQGYWGRPQATVEALRNLWFHTGDIGRFDEDGFFYFVDRKKDYLRRRGENISSMEVEAVFHEHPQVAEAAVYGVPSDVGEDDVQLSVVLRPQATVTEQELCEWSVDRLPHFAVPRYIELCETLPKSVVGRVRKVELRSRRAGYARWDREQSTIDVKRRR